MALYMEIYSCKSSRKNAKSTNYTLRGFASRHHKREIITAQRVVDLAQWLEVQPYQAYYKLLVMELKGGEWFTIGKTFDSKNELMEYVVYYVEKQNQMDFPAEVEARFYR